MEGRRAVFLLIGGLAVMIAGWLAATFYAIPRSEGSRIRYDELLRGIREGRVQNVTVDSADRRASGSLDGRPFWLDYGDSDLSPAFQVMNNALTQAGVAVTIDQQWLKATVKGPLVTTILPALIVADALILGYLLARGTGGFGRSGSRRVRAGESRITFADVAGANEAVEELAEIREFLGNPDRFLAVGARVPRGILLVGPPGCGKTLLARAVAGESDAQFFSISGSAFVEMFVGVGAARIRDLFREAQRTAPAIVFIDELDAIGRGRASSATSDQAERESTLNQLLVSLDGFDQTSGVVVMAATNRPDVLDSALLRRGRFDRTITIDPPDLAGRLAVLEVHTRGMPIGAGVDLEGLARRTAGFTGADLASVVNEAALLAARAGQEQITDATLGEAVERIVMGPQRRSRVLGAWEKEVIAYHECGHAVVAAALSPLERISKISLVTRGRAGGMTWSSPVEETAVTSRDRLVARISMLLGGRAAEEMVMGQPMSTSENDLAAAANLALRMVWDLGMGPQLGSLSLKPWGSPQEIDGRGAPSVETLALADAEVRAILQGAQQRACEVLRDNRPLLERLAARVLERETLEGEELRQMLYPSEEPASRRGVCPD